MSAILHSAASLPVTRLRAELAQERRALFDAFQGDLRTKRLLRQHCVLVDRTLMQLWAASGRERRRVNVSPGLAKLCHANTTRLIVCEMYGFYLAEGC